MQSQNFKALRAYAIKCGIPRDNVDKTLEDFTNDDEAVAKIEKYFDNLKDFRTKGVGLYLHGANGTGKTLLVSISFMMLLKDRRNVAIVSLEELITLYTSGWYDSSVKNEFMQLLNTEYLCVEEIGKEFRPTTSSSTNVAVTTLFKVLEHRLRKKLPTWFTSNVLPEHLSDIYSEDIASRFREMCGIVQVKGEDFRIRKQAEIKKMLK